MDGFPPAINGGIKRVRRSKRLATLHPPAGKQSPPNDMTETSTWDEARAFLNKIGDAYGDRFESAFKDYGADSWSEIKTMDVEDVQGFEKHLYRMKEQGKYPDCKRLQIMRVIRALKMLITTMSAADLQQASTCTSGPTTVTPPPQALAATSSLGSTNEGIGNGPSPTKSSIGIYASRLNLQPPRPLPTRKLEDPSRPQTRQSRTRRIIRTREVDPHDFHTVPSNYECVKGTQNLPNDASKLLPEESTISVHHCTRTSAGAGREHYDRDDWGISYCAKNCGSVRKTFPFPEVADNGTSATLDALTQGKPRNSRKSAPLPRHLIHVARHPTDMEAALQIATQKLCNKNEGGLPVDSGGGFVREMVKNSKLQIEQIFGCQLAEPVMETTTKLNYFSPSSSLSTSTTEAPEPIKKRQSLQKRERGVLKTTSERVEKRRRKCTKVYIASGKRDKKGGDNSSKAPAVQKRKPKKKNAKEMLVHIRSFNEFVRTHQITFYESFDHRKHDCEGFEGLVPGMMQIYDAFIPSNIPEEGIWINFFESPQFSEGLKTFARNHHISMTNKKALKAEMFDRDVTNEWLEAWNDGHVKRQSARLGARRSLLHVFREYFRRPCV